MYLLDTNVVSEIMKVAIDPYVEAWFSRVDVQDIRISDITLAELYRGVARLDEGRRKRLILENITRIESGHRDQIVPFDTACARAYGETSARNERRGKPLDAFDGMLLAVAERYALAIVTRNTKHFEGRTKRVLVNPFRS